MGSKTSKIKSLDGDIITIEFAGENVANGTIEVRDVTTQMDGSAEYEAVKYTTASVTCIVDGLQLLDLYATTPLAVSVKITNETTGKMLFSGYISPNTFNQPLDGYNDELTIECVDCLGIAKFVPYALLELSYGFSTLTLGDVLQHIASLIHVNGVQVADTVRIVSGDDLHTTHRYDLLTVSEQYFFKSINPRVLPSGAAELYPIAETCYDVLKMIAESFRMSWVQEGEIIYLHDYVAARSQGLIPMRQLGAEAIPLPIGSEITLQAESFAAMGSTISITPRPSLYSLESAAADEVPLLQELFSEDTLSPDGGQTRYEDNKYSDDYTVTLAQKLASTVYQVGNNGAIVGYVELKHPGVSSFTDYWSASAWGDTQHKWDTALRFAIPEDNNAVQRVFSRRIAYSTAVPGRNFLALRLKINAAFTNDTSRLAPFDLRTNGTCKLYITLSVGGPEAPLYYNEVNGGWSDEWHLIELIFSDYSSNEWRNTFNANIPGGTQFALFPPTEALAWNIPDGRVDLSFWIPAAEADAGWKVAYIKELSLDLVPRPDVRAINTLNSIPETTYKGTYAYDDEAETVTLPIELEHILAERYFGTKIEGVEYMASSHIEVPWIDSGRWSAKLRFAEAAGSELYDMLERIYRLAMLGDGTEVEITVNDSHNNEITPFTALLAGVWDGRKLPVAISKNYRDNYAKITLL